MEPTIQNTEFGSITVGNELYEHDVVIRLGGSVDKRKKKLSKRLYGTSHKVSLDEAKDIFEKGTTKLIVGSGQYGNVTLSHEAEEYFREKGCAVELMPTPEAIKVWNAAQGDDTIGMFHVTC